MSNINRYHSVLTTLILCLVMPIYLLSSCNSKLTLYSAKDIFIDTIVTNPSGGYYVLFDVPIETMYFPGGYTSKSQNDSLTINIVKRRLNTKAYPDLRKIGVVKESKYLMNLWQDKFTYFIELNTKDNFIRFCDNSTCGSAINLSQPIVKD